MRAVFGAAGTVGADSPPVDALEPGLRVERFQHGFVAAGLIAVGERGTILRTDDGGRKWNSARAPVNSTLLSVQFISEDDGWIVGRNGVILRSDDRGRTWIESESTTRSNLYALFINKKTGWAVGADGLILRYER